MEFEKYLTWGILSRYAIGYLALANDKQKSYHPKDICFCIASLVCERCRKPVSMQLQDLKVLLCEDDVVTSFALAQTLNQQGIEVVAEIQRVSELQQLRQSEFNLVIMDIWLIDDKLGGINAAKQIRKHSEIPIIFQTGYADSDILEELNCFSNSCVIKKPFDMEDLISAIQKVGVA